MFYLSKAFQERKGKKGREKKGEGEGKGRTKEKERERERKGREGKRATVMFFR
jgi:hypothetical protein